MGKKLKKKKLFVNVFEKALRLFFCIFRSFVLRFGYDCSGLFTEYTWWNNSSGRGVSLRHIISSAMFSVPIECRSYIIIHTCMSSSIVLLQIAAIVSTIAFCPVAVFFTTGALIPRVNWRVSYFFLFWCEVITSVCQLLSLTVVVTQYFSVSRWCRRLSVHISFRPHFLHNNTFVLFCTQHVL